MELAIFTIQDMTWPYDLDIYLLFYGGQFT